MGPALKNGFFTQFVDYNGKRLLARAKKSFRDGARTFLSHVECEILNSGE